MANRLFCRYETPSAFYTLQPIKSEDVFFDPDIKIFHNFLNDFEIDYLENLAKNKVDLFLSFMKIQNSI